MKTDVIMANTVMGNCQYLWLKFADISTCQLPRFTERLFLQSDLAWSLKSQDGKAFYWGNLHRSKPSASFHPRPKTASGPFEGFLKSRHVDGPAGPNLSMRMSKNTSESFLGRLMATIMRKTGVHRADVHIPSSTQCQHCWRTQCHLWSNAPPPTHTQRQKRSYRITEKQKKEKVDQNPP